MANADWDALVAQVAETVGVEESAVVALADLVSRLEGAVNMEQVRQITADLKAREDALGAAIAAIPPQG